jgi:DNA polymerase IV
VKKIILHIDFDSFFASAEQQLNPLYRNRPIGVTATNGRTCIIAASREAKALGIKSPSRTFDARRICPEIIFVPAHFTIYWEISKKFINICKDFSPYVEIFSLDEVFMDITETARLFGGTYPLIENIKKRLEREIGPFVTASFGISHNKLLAKLASGLAKPARRQAGQNGQVEIKEADIMGIYTKAQLTDICGIGFRIEKRLNQMGIYTLLKLRTTPLSALVAEFGEVEGNFLYQAGQGIDNREVVPYTEAPDVKSVGRSYCLPRNEYDQRVVMQNVFELYEEIGIKLRRLNKKARRVGIYLRGDESFSVHKTYSNYMDQGKELFEASLSLLGNWILPTYVRQIGVWASNLSDADRIPSSLFENPKQAKLLKAVDSINEKFGPHTLRNGFLLYADKLTTVPNGFMADRYERVKYAKEQSQALST